MSESESNHSNEQNTTESSSDSENTIAPYSYEPSSSDSTTSLLFPSDVIMKPHPQQEVCITWIFDSSYLLEEWTFKHQIFYGPRASNNCKKKLEYFFHGTYPSRRFLL